MTAVYESNMSLKVAKLINIIPTKGRGGDKEILLLWEKRQTLQKLKLLNVTNGAVRILIINKKSVLIQAQNEQNVATRT
nr:hypothetical protein CFP56_29255 [Quercus suber]